MKNESSRANRANRSLPAIVAFGSSLAALPAGALELGEFTVHSRLGQPLRASIAYALAPSEQLSDYCVRMRPGPSVSGLPGFGAATVSVANGVIMLTGQTPVREPMVSAHVVVNCPYSANLSREYMLFIDPLSPAYDQVAVTQQTNPVAEPIAVAAAAIRRPVPATAARPAQPVQKDIAASTRYQVRAGESLSTIAERIENRSIGLWPAVNAIFAANPDAFMNNDPNQLKAGSWLSIPSFDGGVTAVAAATPVADVVELVPADIQAYDPAIISEPTVTAEAAIVSAPSEVILDDLADTGVTTGDLQPGDIIFDTQMQGPTTSSSSPNVPTAIITTRTSGNESSATPSWLMWLGGSGIALIFGLLMFGRRLRDNPETAPAAASTGQANRRFTDSQMDVEEHSDAQEQPEPQEQSDTASVEVIDADYDLTDESPTEENLALDANLVIGTDLEAESQSSPAEDFEFTPITEVDIELPFETIAPVSDATEMLPPLRTDEVSILDSEVLPEGDDDEYDMSVIVDATKMPRPEDVTERDLKAVEIASDDETAISNTYTINKQVDFQVLEQDYEDEMTATQALNDEIAKAAAELAVRMDDGADNNDATTALPLATVTELDITAQMPAQNDADSDPDDTAIIQDDTGAKEEITVNKQGEDDTVEMPIESGKAS